MLKGGLEALLEVLAAAKNAPNKVGDATLDPNVERAFNELNTKENEHQNLFVARNCKAEAEKLLNRAEALRAQDAKAASKEPTR